MKIALLVPFFSGSHKAWAEGYQQSSQHHVEIFSLPGRHWKWRMHGGAISLAQQYNVGNFKADFILATDMLDLAVFLSLTRHKTANIPNAIYFHENQLTYPWSENDPDVKLKRDNHYAFINYTSALSADQVLFNSQYHLSSFLDSLPAFLKQFPDHQSLSNVDLIRNKSQVLSLGMSLKRLDGFKPNSKSELPIILWNHRWEYDKKPTVFFEALFQLKREQIPFKLIILGASYRQQPAIFEVTKKRLADEIIHFGYAKNSAAYASLLWQANLLPVCGVQDFFGGSVIEAIYCNCFPILPKRLAYPEHLPINLHNQHYYENDIDFYPFLKTTIASKAYLGDLNDISTVISLYDWSILSPIYDEIFKKKIKQ